MRNPTQLARDVFCSVIKRCVTADEETYLLELRYLAELANGNSHIQRCIEELLLEVTRWRVDFSAKEHLFQEQIIKLRRTLLTAVPSLAEEGEGTPLCPTIPYFDKLMSGEWSFIPTASADPGIDDSPRRDLLNALSFIVQRCYGRQEDSPEEIREALVELPRQSEWLYREQLNFARAHPGVVWLWVWDAVQRINPIPKPVDWTYYLSEWSQDARRGIRLEKVLYGWRSKSGALAPTEEERAYYKVWKTQMDAGLRRLSSEVGIRLATRASSEWALRRYVARSAVYRYKELQDRIHQHKEGRQAQKQNLAIERVLVDDAAAYLFDLGFPVLTERHLASGRLDIYQEVLGINVASDALLVEAKVYTSAATGKKAVYSGIAQLYGYATAIESSFHPTENFLLVYRLGGPKLVLPREAIPMGDYYVRLVHVDLEPPTQSGSRSPKPVTLDLDGIIEQVLDKQAAAHKRDYHV